MGIAKGGVENGNKGGVSVHLRFVHVCSRCLRFRLPRGPFRTKNTTTIEKKKRVKEVRFCALFGALSGIGGNPTFWAD